MSAIRMLVAGIGGLTNFAIIMLLIFCNGIITKAVTEFVMGGTYKFAFGINMIPAIQAAILLIALVGMILCFVVIWQEVFSEVAYYPEY